MITKDKITARVFLGLVVSAGIAAPALGGAPTGDIARPQGFPEHPLVMVVPYGPGGGSGQLARAMIEAVAAHTDVAIAPKYVPGAAGMTGLKAYMEAPADGYTVLEHIDDATSAFAIGKSEVHPGRDLIPLLISQITFSQIYIRAGDYRYTDWESFLAYIQGGGHVTMANVAGKGSMERINMMRIAKHFGIRIQQVSFDAGGARYAALHNGQVDALFEQPGDVRKYLKSGDFKPILTLLPERPQAFATIPSMTDVGLTFAPLMRFRGFYVHATAPPERVRYLRAVFQRAFSAPGFQAFNKNMYMDLIPSFRDTEGARTLIAETLEIYRRTYKEMGLID